MVEEGAWLREDAADAMAQEPYPADIVVRKKEGTTRKRVAG